MFSIHDYEKDYISSEKIFVIILSEQNKMWFVKSYNYMYIYVHMYTYIYTHIHIYTYAYAMYVYFIKVIKLFPSYIMTLLNYIDRQGLEKNMDK